MNTHFRCNECNDRYRKLVIFDLKNIENNIYRFINLDPQAAEAQSQFN